jgi:hypothetical protein
VLALLFAAAGAAAQEPGFADPVVAATHKLFNPASTGTCFLVRADGRTHLLTAAHVLEKAKGGQMLLVARIPTEDGDFRREDRPIRLEDGGKPVWRRHPKVDAALITLDEDAARGTQPLDLAQVADAEGFRQTRPAMGAALWTLTYPERLESTPSGFPLLRRGAFASPTQLPAEKHPMFLADLPAFAGDSGGPAFVAGREGRPAVIGMVVKRYHHDTKPPGWKAGDPLVREPLAVAGILRSEFLRQLLPPGGK